MQKEEKETKLNKFDFLKIIANALKLGSVNSNQAKNMRQELGVFSSYFTKKQYNTKTRRQRRKMQKRARKITLFHGFKGQKVNKGI